MRQLLWGGALCAVFIGAPDRANAQGASPGDFEIWPEVLLGGWAPPEPFYLRRGVGAPSVAYDPVRRRYLMAFEFPLDAGDPACPAGRWGLGLAWSEDGVTGWEANPRPLLIPREGTFYGCVAAQPTMVFDARADAAILFFKGEQALPADPAIGPHRYTGVGRLTVQFDPRGRVQGVRPSATPVLEIPQVFGFPRVIRAGGEYHLAVSISSDIWMAHGDGRTFTLESQPALVASEANPPWARDELFSPALVCEDDPDFPYSMYLGGRVLAPDGSVVTGGLGHAISADLQEWFLSARPFFSIRGDRAWRHWDVLRVDSRAGSEYLLYYAERDARGRSRIRLATTSPLWSDHLVSDKTCGLKARPIGPR